MKIDIYILIGNHDIYFKNTNKVNSLQQLCTAPDGVNEVAGYMKGYLRWLTLMV